MMPVTIPISTSEYESRRKARGSRMRISVVLRGKNCDMVGDLLFRQTNRSQRGNLLIPGGPLHRVPGPLPLTVYGNATILPKDALGEAMADQSIELFQGTLDLLILKTLSWGSTHGYSIARWIQQVTGDVL